MLATTEMLLNLFPGNETAVSKPVQNIDRRLVVEFAITRHAAINASVTWDRRIDSRKAFFSLTSTIFLLNPRPDHNGYIDMPDNNECVLILSKLR